MDMGTLDFDHVIHEFDTLSMGFSKLTLDKIYFVQHVAATKIWIWENALVYQETKQKRKAKKCKTLLREKEQEIEA